MSASFASELGVSVCILPHQFLTAIERDATAELMIPANLLDFHCTFALSSMPNHWCLTGFDLRSKKIYYLDPQAKPLSEMAWAHISLIRRIVWIHILGNEVSSDEQIDSTDWNVVTSNNFSQFHTFALPLQIHGSDCGIFCVLYAWYIMECSYMDFTISDMVHSRQWFLKQLFMCCVTSTFQLVIEKQCEWFLMATIR